jgi:hypothetical protein
MTMYQAIVLANGIAQDKPEIKNIGKCMVFDNLIGDCFRVMRMKEKGFIKFLEKWRGCNNFTNELISAVYISAKVVFDNHSIEMD